MRHIAGENAAYTQEGNTKDLDWRNNDVEFHILSTRRMTRGGNFVGYGGHGGVVAGPNTSTNDACIAHGEV